MEEDDEILILPKASDAAGKRHTRRQRKKGEEAMRQESDNVVPAEGMVIMPPKPVSSPVQPFRRRPRPMTTKVSPETIIEETPIHEESGEDSQKTHERPEKKRRRRAKSTEFGVPEEKEVCAQSNDRGTIVGNADHKETKITQQIKQKPTSTVFQCVREKKHFGTRMYMLLLNGEKLFTAKTNPISNSDIFFNQGDSCHIKGLHEYKINVSHFSKCYDVTKSGDPYVIMNVNVVPQSQPIEYDRYFEIAIHLPDSKSTLLHTEMPHLNKNGKFMLSFGPTFIRESIKNAILMDKCQKRRLIIRRISDDLIDVELISGEDEIPLYAVFAFGVISWECQY